MRPAGAQMLEVSQILTSPVEAVYLPVSTGQNHCAEGLEGNPYPAEDADRRSQAEAPCIGRSWRLDERRVGSDR